MCSIFKKSVWLSILFLSIITFGFAQDSNELLQKVRNKLEVVNEYEAEAVMITDIPFLKVPKAKVKVYFKKPDKLKIKNEKGISFVPKGATSINLNNVVSGNKFTVIDAGTETINGIQAKVLKLLPEDENRNVILSTIYIDERNEVIIKARTTTRDNGTYELEMKYGKFILYGLPDVIIFTFNTKDYKIPKGVTFDYDDPGARKMAEDKSKNKQGKVEIDYSSYRINKGVSDEMFK